MTRYSIIWDVINIKFFETKKIIIIKPSSSYIFLQLHKDKPMHGVFYKNIEDLGLSKRLTFAMLRSLGLKSKTPGIIMACQDGVFNTLVYRSRVMGMEIPGVSRRACRSICCRLVRHMQSRPISRGTTQHYECFITRTR